MKLLTRKKILMGKSIKKKTIAGLLEPKFLVTPGNPTRDAQMLFYPQCPGYRIYCWVVINQYKSIGSQ